MRLIFKNVLKIIYAYYGKENVLQVYKMDDKPYYSVALKDFSGAQLRRDDLLLMNKEVGYVVR